MRSTGRFLLSRIGQQHQPYSLGALHSARYATTPGRQLLTLPLTCKQPFGEERRGVRNVVRNCLSWIKNKLEVRVIVPEAKAYVVEDGFYVKTFTPGIHSVSRLYKVARVLSLKEETISIPHWPTITKDAYDISIDGRLSIKIVDPKLACQNIENCSKSMHDSVESIQPMDFVILLAQITMKNMIKCMTLREAFEKRDTLNEKILMRLRGYAKDWGFACLRYEIREISFIAKSKEMMEKRAIRLYEHKAEMLALKAEIQTIQNKGVLVDELGMIEVEAHRKILNLGPPPKAKKLEQYQNA